MNSVQTLIIKIFRKLYLELYKIKYFKQYLINYIFLPITFHFFSFSPIKKNLVVFAVHRFNKLPYNMELLYDLCNKNGYICKLFLMGDIKHIKSNIVRSIKTFISVFNFIKYYAICTTIFVDNYFPYLYAIKPRKGVNVVQLWHGCGAFKKFGYSCINKKFGFSELSLKLFPTHNTYTDVMVSSPTVIPYYAEAFNCKPSIIKPFGVPRTDWYFNKYNLSSSVLKIKEMFPEIGKRKVLLYAPTFRGKTTVSYFYDIINYNYLSFHLKDKYVFLTKYHPYTIKLSKLESENTLPENFVYDITDKLTIEDALCASDIVITDYSSLIFEFSLLERPMIFLAYDLDEYDNDRGFYLPYRDFVPGPIVKDNDSLFDAILNAYSDESLEKVKVFRDKFMSSCDGNSTDRIYKYIFGNKKAV